MSQSIQWSLREEGPRAVVTAERPDDGRGLYKAYAVGPKGRLLLGTLMPEGKTLRLRRIVSLDELRRSGAWPVSSVAGELAFPFGGGDPPPGWTWTDRPGELFQEPSLLRQASRLGRVLVRKEGQRWTLACPYRADKEFPLPEIFCFSRIKRINQREYCLFSFDAAGWPVYEKSE